MKTNQILSVCLFLPPVLWQFAFDRYWRKLRSDSALIKTEGYSRGTP